MITAKEAKKLTAESIADRKNNKWEYIERQIKTSPGYSTEFDYLSEYELNDDDVIELEKLGYEVVKRYENNTSYIVSWK